ncbi:hypothetical protein CD30_18190 [Ureibacillus massiliensis 4400831 = CIP 108448 = CCUG 49529]|uniref:FAD-binding PCMH-type domain-containing protein n=1 Tax=Ureibacillus massiliensis 4400831 = CIP 108448 = CCUG 49529 TaxID=1211035 RepID=A0A0A3IV27_9BACL|nr:FAD binding domain-containing protein [Ureibacillus massiliensis]KGR88639.1 hypothetical protein CD30_18190 [Ureibacillus massiliensis 4400831 = CIP 108448 = CCUG 49529]
MSIQPNVSNLKPPVIWMPKSIEKVIELKHQFGSNASFVSGATLLQLQWQNGHILPHHLLSLENIPTLKEMKMDVEKKHVSIGSMVTLAQCRFEPLFKKSLPILFEAVKTIAAPAVRNRATIGGNIMGGVGDLIPLLITLNAKLVISENRTIKTIELYEWVQRKEEFNQPLLIEILIPYEEMDGLSSVFYKKIGRRETFTAAIITVSGKIKWDPNGKIYNANLAIGGGDNNPALLQKTMGELIGKSMEDIDWKKVYASLLSEILPTEDVFVSGKYRKKAAANIIVAELQNSVGIYGTREEQVHEI